MWYKVDVSREHISNGIATDPYSCPVALALKDMGLCDVKVDYIYATFATSEGGPRHTIRLSKQTQTFMYAFDFGKSVEPFVFEAVVKAPRNTLRPA